MQHPVDNKKTRRSVLRSLVTTGAVVTASGFVAGSASAEGSTEYVGVHYDPQTTDVIGEASAKLTATSKELVGTIKYGDQRININNGNPLSKEGIAGKVFKSIVSVPEDASLRPELVDVINPADPSAHLTALHSPSEPEKPKAGILLSDEESRSELRKKLE